MCSSLSLSLSHVRHQIPGLSLIVRHVNRSGVQKTVRRLRSSQVTGYPEEHLEQEI